ncbi:SCP2 domain-containing protein [Shewanella sp. NIFS-20-20]|uniref:ubiquinone anaerobic biosynthesis accessory factor UbiT n=1 Tax=Shewanella sp. NIFS-20-20 TaxID=2853806 RepID=UPI001C47D2E5|nr:SCP2 sterol-binding domain-containing protein [Shewanella sp. NIFS-20-20]MBV7314950.1 SCP2 sterol-binding domain-containing protein [Shewanella sp. NIFS-20-20]
MSASERAAQRLLSLAPKCIALPVQLMPFTIKAKILAQVLDLSVSRQFAAEELAFLYGRPVGIVVSDLNVQFTVVYQGRWQINEAQSCDVTFTANSRELLLILAAKEDPDTLFFQRKLAMQGNTEFGLAVKNLLMSIELDSQPGPVKHGILGLTQLLLGVEKRAGIEHVYLS